MMNQLPNVRVAPTVWYLVPDRGDMFKVKRFTRTGTQYRPVVGKFHAGSY